MTISLENNDGTAPAPKCAHDYQISCSNCRLNAVCLPLALETKEIDKLDTIVKRRDPMQKGESLYHQGEQFNSVFAVRPGTLKAFRTSTDGREQVTGFYFPGEIMGMDGIAKNTHACSALALETASVCEIPFSALQDLSLTIPSLQGRFFQIMSREIAEDQQLITLLSKNTSEERISALILSVSARNARRKLSATNFRLPMSRIDIGNYLGLTVETVSRVFSRLQKLGVLEVNNKEIAILDIHALQDIANIVIET